MNEQSLAGKVFLIAEDDPTLREIIGFSLEFYGAKVLSAESGNSAIALFTDNPVDVIVSDMRMPDGDGLDFLRAVRQRSPTAPPFFFLTAYSEASRDTVMKEGAQGMFAKPFDVEQMVKRILDLIPHSSERS